MYKLSDRVETGHFKNVGGTLYIDLEFDKFVDKEKYLTILDYLDHCIISDSLQISEFAERYFILDKSFNLFEDVISIISNFLPGDELVLISVRKGKETYSSYPNTKSKILKYKIKG